MRRAQHLLTYVLVLAVFAAGASALTVSQPTNTTYDGLVPVQITAGENQTALAYTISTNQSVVANSSCSNCSQLNSTQNLTSGDYRFFATATGANTSENRTVHFSVALPEQNQTPLNLSVNEPENKSYQGLVPINISTNTPANISYALNDDNQSLACENCTSHTDEFNLSAGNYSLFVLAQAGDQSVNETVAFRVQTPVRNDTGNQTTLNLSINKPENKSYVQIVPINISTSTAANISYALNDGNQSLACENCTGYAATLNLSNGTYLFSAFASAGNQSVNESVVFEVLAIPEDNETDNETDDPDNRTFGDYGPVFNKLPQAVAAGELTDEQLADIIRENPLNPGVINRLVKTGQLGNQSIDAIIEHQRTPPGILRKVVGFFGWHIPTPKERLVQEYNLSSEQQTNLLTQDDVSEQAAQEIREQIERRGPPAFVQERRQESQADNNQARDAGPAFDAGGQGPPAFVQERRQESQDDEQRQANASRAADERGPPAFVTGGERRGQDQEESGQEDARRGPPSSAGQSDDRADRGNGRPASPGNSGNARGRGR